MFFQKYGGDNYLFRSFYNGFEPIIITAIFYTILYISSMYNNHYKIETIKSVKRIYIVV